MNAENAASAGRAHLHHPAGSRQVAPGGLAPLALGSAGVVQPTHHEKTGKQPHGKIDGSAEGTAHAAESGAARGVMNLCVGQGSNNNCQNDLLRCFDSVHNC